MNVKVDRETVLGGHGRTGTSVLRSGRVPGIAENEADRRGRLTESHPQGWGRIWGERGVKLGMDERKGRSMRRWTDAQR
jgi:hypothetical protein